MAAQNGPSTEKIAITVNPDTCMGIRSCVRTAPGSFVIEKNNVSRGVAQPTDDLTVVLDAAAGCPNFAITVAVDDEVVFDPEAQ